MIRAFVLAWAVGRVVVNVPLTYPVRPVNGVLVSGMLTPEGVDFTNRVIYYVGPVDPVGDEVVGPAGPTTSTRMDKFTEMMLAETGLIGMVGKAERGPAAIRGPSRVSTTVTGCCSPASTTAGRTTFT